MMDNYPDDVPAGSLRAPWNQDDREYHLLCGECGEEPEDKDAAELDGPCQNVAPMFTKTGTPIAPCDGLYYDPAFCDRD